MSRTIFYGLKDVRAIEVRLCVKIPRKCHDHKAQPYRGTKRRRDEEQMTIKRHI